MNFKVTLASFLFLLALSLIAFGFSLLGLPGTVVDSIWKLIALSIGVSLVMGFLYPYLRGVKSGDALATNMQIIPISGAITSLFTGINAVALQDGRKGEKIKINFQGRRAEGIIVSYASTFSPAMVKITEMEKPMVQTFKA